MSDVMLHAADKEIAELKAQLKDAEANDKIYFTNTAEMQAHIKQLREHLKYPDKPTPKKWRVVAQSLVKFTPSQSLANIKAEWSTEKRDEIMQNVCEHPVYDNKMEDAYNYIYDDLYKVVSNVLELKESA